MNMFYLVGGILTTLMAVLHAVWGEKFIIPDLKKSTDLEDLPKIGLYIPWHQITNTLLISGLALLLIAFNETIQGIDILGLFIGFIIAGNFVVFILISYFNNRALFRQSILQMLIFTLILIMILLGIRA